MRLFFALPLSAEAREATDRWRRGNLLIEGRRVPAANFHITLCFLGNLDASALAGLTAAADRIAADSFDLTLDTPGYFPGPRVFWIGPCQVPDSLSRLAGSLDRAARRLGITPERRRFRPHLTLTRRCRDPVSAPLNAPDIPLHCDRFCLMESRSGRGGVHYSPIDTWRLGSSRI